VKIFGKELKTNAFSSSLLNNCDTGSVTRILTEYATKCHGHLSLSDCLGLSCGLIAGHGSR
jgi:hypothetical protein